MTHSEAQSNIKLAQLSPSNPISKLAGRPSTGMSIGLEVYGALFDHPQRTLDWLRDLPGVGDVLRAFDGVLGLGPGPNSIYHPAEIAPDGSFRRGYSETPMTPGMPEVPISQ